MEEGPDHSNRGGTRGYCHAGRVARRRGVATAETGHAGRVVARPDVLMRTIAPHTERAGCGGVRPDVPVRAGLCRCHTKHAADTPRYQRVAVIDVKKNPTKTSTRVRPRPPVKKLE